MTKCCTGETFSIRFQPGLISLLKNVLKVIPVVETEHEVAFIGHLSTNVRQVLLLDPKEVLHR